MIFPTRPVQWFAWFSIAQALFHFSFETLAYVQYGSFLPMLLIDYIAIALLLAGSVGLLRWGWGPGPLCGAWGVEFCLYYRALFWRVGDFTEKGADSGVSLVVIYFLSTLLAVSTVALLVSIVVSIRYARSVS